MLLGGLSMYSSFFRTWAHVLKCIYWWNGIREGVYVRLMILEAVKATHRAFVMEWMTSLGLMDWWIPLLPSYHATPFHLIEASHFRTIPSFETQSISFHDTVPYKNLSSTPLSQLPCPSAVRTCDVSQQIHTFLERYTSFPELDYSLPQDSWIESR